MGDSPHPVPAALPLRLDGLVDAITNDRVDVRQHVPRASSLPPWKSAHSGRPRPLRRSSAGTSCAWRCTTSICMRVEVESKGCECGSGNGEG
eukprot:154258-Chlamydomonas_euryale.AAC.2